MRLSAAALLAALGLCVSSPVAHAQLLRLSAGGQPVIVQEGLGEELMVVGPDGVLMQVNGNGAPANAAAPTGSETPRLTKLKALTYDRRPSAYLAAWSKELLPPEPPPKVETPPAAPAPMPETPPAAPPADETPEAKAAREKTEAEAKAAKEKAEAEAKVAKEKAEKAAAEEKALTEELTKLQTHVTLGRWDEVQKYLAGLPEPEKKAGYIQMLASLANGSPEGGGYWPQEANVFALDDLVGLTRAAPIKLELEQLQKLGAILSLSLRQELVIDVALARLREEVGKAENPLLTERQLSQLLTAAGQAEHIGEFLPKLEEAIAAKDDEGLNLLTLHFEAVYAEKRKPVFLEQAWQAIQAVLSVPEGERKEKQAALKRAVELAPRVRKELGETWLAESFTRSPERGVEILSVLGGEIANGFRNAPRDPDSRKRAFELQKSAIDALGKANAERAAQWRPTLTLLADSWLREATYSRDMDSQTSYGPRMNRDLYGNLFYMDDMSQRQMMMQQNQNQPLPISTTDVLKVRPEKEWFAQLPAEMKPKLLAITAGLYLKVNEEKQAFPLISELATMSPELAKPLATQFLNVWGNNHNPNSQSSYTNPYMFYYGFEQRAQSIPLTRSKQERNLAELAEWIAKLRSLPLEDLDESLIATAFTSVHSTAEVYRLESIEKVFGPVGKLKAKSLGALVEQMRSNLAGLWRAPQIQEQAKTNRKLKDIQAEVSRGYEVAASVAAAGLAQHGDDWSLRLAHAALMHDLNNFEQELAKDSKFSKQREAALAEFAEAAKLYHAKVETLTEDEEGTEVFELWFYAALGACDLGALNEENQPDVRQYALIRDAILALPGKAAERHMNRFANLLFNRMSSVKPAAKFRYVKAGFDIVGDHEQALEAKKVYDYYKDLVTEIRFETAVDGSDAVGQQPFGVFVNLHHTREIERESGGFAKYLQNQNSGMYFSWNYGRPTADYRDRFTTHVNKVLGEQFNVLSVTFQSDKVNSRASKDYGWRTTPYAYLLLKAKGPQVDKLPPLKLDLDFLDTSGYVVLPVETAALPLDCKTAQTGDRPVADIHVTQTLDERQAADGKLVLEVKANSLGLVPDLKTLLDLKPAGFEVKEIDDRGVSVVKFDDEAEQNAVRSDRLWQITFAAQGGKIPPGTKFEFGKPKLEVKESLFQRYNDADLEAVQADYALAESYGKPQYSSPLPWLIGGGAAILAIGLIGWWGQRPRQTSEKTSAMPKEITPFTVLALLERVRKSPGLTPAQSMELEDAIRRVERRYFADQADDSLDLRAIATKWAALIK